MPRLRAPLLLTLLALASARAQGPPAFAFDLVIRNGRVMDPESGLDRAGLWVGIRGATIAAISDTALAGRTVLDAGGQVVAPGFIDVLSYEPNPYGVWNKLADGVTTNLAMHGAASDMGAWYRVLGRSRWPINYGGAFSEPNARCGSASAATALPPRTRCGGWWIWRNARCKTERWA